MIRLKRGSEPPELVEARTKRLEALRKLIEERGRDPRSEEIEGYGLPSVRSALYEGQWRKCCYCEKAVEPDIHPVEHYRPKSRVAAAGHLPKRSGYWWLSYTWSNLLYSCNICNGKKGIKFPLAKGSTPLSPEEAPPGTETPLLLNPYDEAPENNPVDLIEFRRIRESGLDNWIPYARTGDPRARCTIQNILKLDWEGRFDLYRNHVRTAVMHHVDAVKTALQSKTLKADVSPLWRTYSVAIRLLLSPESYYSALSYDALRHFVPDESLVPHLKRGWPKPPVSAT